MKTIHRYFVLLVIVPLVIFLGSCSKTAENEHLPEYCQTYSGFMATASKDLYDLIGGIDRQNYLSVISEIELEFDVDEPGVEIDLDGIQCFQNLTSLTLIGQSFKDISPISALKNIQKIVLIDTSIVSIDSFKNLSKVNELTISNTKTLQSVDGVEEMTKLTRLDLSDNGIVNIDGLNNLVNLTELVLTNNEITYLPSINRLEFLETLDVSNNSIERLGEDLSGLSNLTEFIARDNQICDLSTLDDLVSLEILDLSENDLGCLGAGISPDFSSLENAPNLREIYLNDNELTSIENLRGKTLPLEVLHLENNNLTDITPISDYTDIQELVLFNNNIVDIDDLSGMTNVTEIDLSENSILDFSDLLSIPNLEFIDLSDNNITVIPDMSDSWLNLRVLDLDSNDIIDTSGVDGHVNLRELILSNNGMTELIGISNLPRLESLVMFQEIPEIIPEDFEFEDNPNDISVIRDSFNNLPLLELTDELDIFDFGFELGSNIEIYGSINDIDNVGTIDFSGMEIDIIDEFSINLNSLLAIDVSDNNITDISFIIGNPSLQRLNISDNSISNLSVISGVDTSDLDELDQIEAANITTSNVLLNAFIELPELGRLNLNGTNITSIENSFNDLNELTDLGIDSQVLGSIINSFNNLYAVHTVNNIISFSDSQIGIITDSFNNGLYEQIVIQDNIPAITETIISNSFNGLDVANNTSILISGNDFKTIEGSFNDTTTANLFLGGNGIETITTSFENLEASVMLNLQSNEIENIIGLNTVTSIATLDLSGNRLITVSFLDGITGLESLDISNQYDSGLDTLTLNDIDGINNMPLLTEIVIEEMLILTIDGFKTIGIEAFVLSDLENEGGIITSISPTSFLNSLVTDLDLSGHEIDDVSFLSNFSLLTDLAISTDIADLSDFEGTLFESTLDSLSLSNVQEVTDFGYLSGYDALTFFDFSSILTTTINNFDGFDLLTNSNFEDEDTITAITNSFNDMGSLNLSNDYLSIFPSLANIGTSFDIYDTSGNIEIRGDIVVVDSFNNVGALTLDSGTETAVNFDVLSFDNIHTMNIADSYYDSYSFLDLYASLSTLTIQDLSKNITDLTNENITSFDITNINPIVTVLTIDIADTGSISYDTSVAVTLTLTTDSSNLDLNSTNGEVILELDNSVVNLNGELNILTVNSANLVSVNLDDMATTNMTINADLLNLIERVTTATLNANNLEVNSLSTTLDIDVRANTVNLYDNLATTYDLVVTGGDANLFSDEANLLVDFTGEDLNIAQDTLVTIDINGNINDITIDSNNIDDVNLNTAVVNGLDITSLQNIMSVVGTNITTLQLTNDSITDPTLTVDGAAVTLSSITAAPLNIDIIADVLVLETVNTLSLVFDTDSSLNDLNLTDGTSVNSITYNTAAISSTHLVSDEATISIVGANITDFDLDAANLTDITFNTSGAILDIDTSTVVIAADIIATTVDIDSAGLTDLALTNTSSIETLNVLNSTLVDNLSFGTANIDNLNVDSNAANMNISSVNSLETALNGNSFISVITDLGSNNLQFTSSKTTSMSFDITASDVDLTTSLNTISIDNASSIDNLTASSDTLANVLAGSATITSLVIDGSSNSLGVSGSNLTTLVVDDPLITTFDADVGLTTDVDFNTLATSEVTITTTSDDITITSLGDITLTSATLLSSTINIGVNDADFALSKAALDYTLEGTMGYATVNSSTMNNFIVGTGLSVDTLEIINDNINSLDLSPGVINNLVITSANTSMDILGNSLDTIIMNMNNLDNVTINSSYNGASVDVNTFAASLSLNGEIDNATVVGNSLNSIDLNGIIGNVDVSGSSLTSVDLINADYNNLVLDCDILANLDTLTSVSTSLEVTTTINDFNLTSNIPTLDFVGDSIDNFNLTTTATAMNITTTNNSVSVNGTISDITIDGDNLSILNFAGTITTVNTTTQSTSFSLNGTVDNVSVIGNSLNSIDLNGTIDTVNVNSTSLTSVDLNGANYNDLVLNSNLLASLNTLAGVNTSLEVTSLVDDFDLTTNTPTVSFFGNAINNVNLTSTALAIDLSTTNDSVTLDGATTDFVISGSNLNIIIGDAQSVDITNQTGSDEFIIDLDADSVIFNSDTSTALSFTGVRTITALDVTSTSIISIDTSDVVITTLDYESSGINSSVDSKATTINHTNTSGDEIVFTISSDTQTLNTNSEIVSLESVDLSSTVLNYSGVNNLSVSLNGLTTPTINTPNASTVNFDGSSVNVILSGASIDTVNTDTLTLTNKYTMNNTLVDDLEFISANLLISIIEIEVNTLDAANVGSVVTKLESSGVTLVSPIVSQDIYDYYYDEEYTALTDQEVIDTLRYTGFRDTAIADALAEFRLNVYFDYILDAELNTQIDTQLYLTTQDYFDGYALDEGTTEVQMVLDNDQQFVDDIKAAIQATLDQPILTIVELTLETSVENSIVDDANTYATTENGNVGFNIG